MYFSNMLGAFGEGVSNRTKTKGKGVCFFNNSVGEPTTLGSVVIDGNTLRVSEEVGSDKDITGKLWSDDNPERLAELADTEENPLIWVLTDNVAFFPQIGTYFKFCFINPDMILFCLIEGACAIGSDRIVLSRNTTANIPDEKNAVGYKPEDLLKFASLIDKETGYNMAVDSVVACRVALKESQMSVKTLRDLSIIMSYENRDFMRKKKEERERRAEERKAAILESRRKAEKVDRERRQKEELEAEGQTFGDVDSSGQNTSAAAFLNLVRGL